MWSVGSLFCTAVVGALVVLTLLGMWQHGGVPVDLGWDVRLSGDAVFVRSVERNGPAFQKLYPRDRLIAVTESPRLAAITQPRLVLMQTKPYSLRVERAGGLIALTLPVWRLPGMSWIFDLDLLIAVTYLALTVLLLSTPAPGGVVKITALFFLTIATTVVCIPLQAYLPRMPTAIAAWLAVFTSPLLRPLGAALIFDFAIRFPQPIAQPIWLVRARKGIYWFSAAVIAIGILPLEATLFDLPTRSSLWPPMPPLAVYDRWRPVLVGIESVLVIVGLPPLLYWNYRRLPAESERRKLRWVGLGICIALLPLGLGILLRISLDLLPAAHPNAALQIEFFRDTAGTFGTILIPISITYAIVRHRLLGIRLTIRRGVQYLLARNVLRGILSLPVVLALVYLVRHSNEPLRDVVLHGSLAFDLGIALTAAASLRYRKRLSAWVDRRFFRSAYEEEIILSDLIARLQQCDTAFDVARTLAAQLQDALQPTKVCVILRGSAFSTGSDRSTIIYPEHSPLAVEFCQQQPPASPEETVVFEGNFPGSNLESCCSNWERRYPADRVTLIRDAKGSPVGVILLSTKKSEQSYTRRDVRLLATLAVQVGLVIEMLALKDQVRDDERIRFEVLGRLDQQGIQLVLECPDCGRCYDRPYLTCRVDGATLALTLPIERVIDRKYRLERRIGAGAMGVVYAASDLRLNRRVAVKVITGRLFGNTAALRRFEREARTVAALQHPGIVNVFDFGTVRGGGAYIVMQLVDGHSWRAEMQANGAVTPARAADWFDQLCDALDCAHQADVLHRDLKPENLLVNTRDPNLHRITILDFGLAKVFQTDPAERALSVEGHAIGTYGYMSPEQRRGAAVDRRTDLYSLGVLSVEVLTHAQPPLAGSSPDWVNDTLKSHASSSPAWQNLRTLLCNCVADDPRQRPDDVIVLRRHLIPLLRACPTVAFSPVPVASGGESSTLLCQEA